MTALSISFRSGPRGSGETGPSPRQTWAVGWLRCSAIFGSERVSRAPAHHPQLAQVRERPARPREREKVRDSGLGVDIGLADHLSRRRRRADHPLLPHGVGLGGRRAGRHNTGGHCWEKVWVLVWGACGKAERREVCPRPAIPQRWFGADNLPSSFFLPSSLI